MIHTPNDGLIYFTFVFIVWFAVDIGIQLLDKNIKKTKKQKDIFK